MTPNLTKFNEVTCVRQDEGVVFPEGNVTLRRIVKELEAPCYIDTEQIMAFYPLINDFVWVAAEEGPLFYPNRTLVVLKGGGEAILAYDPMEFCSMIGNYNQFAKFPARRRITFDKYHYGEHGETTVLAEVAIAAHDIWVRKSSASMVAPDVDKTLPPEEQELKEGCCLLFYTHHDSGWTIDLSVEEVLKLLRQ